MLCTVFRTNCDFLSVYNINKLVFETEAERVYGVVRTEFLDMPLKTDGWMDVYVCVYVGISGCVCVCRYICMFACFMYVCMYVCV